MIDFFQQKIKSVHGDEYYSPQNVVDMIMPYIPKDKKIWCPFDKFESKFVQTFIGGGTKYLMGILKQVKTSLIIRNLKVILW